MMSHLETNSDGESRAMWPSGRSLIPGVSVQMSAYNAMPFLVDAVESILKQTYQDFDFVIIDDGSTDDSVEYLRSIADPRIQVICQPNRGTAAANNHGLQHCRREYLARMDADDWSDPDRLRLQAEALDCNPEASIVGSCFAYFGSRTAGPRIPMPLEHDAINAALMAGDHGLVHGASMMRTESMLRIGGYWEHPFFEDWDLFLRLGEVGQLMNLPQSLYLYRAHATSLSSSRLDEMRTHYNYAIAQAKRRRSGIPTVSLDTFMQQNGTSSGLSRINAKLDNLALRHYRQAMGEIYSTSPWKGRARLYSSALWSPARTLQRVRRGIGSIFA
ncbi:MAG: glycosyltransferase family 2 protein [Planctomycetota bacterium]